MIDESNSFGGALKSLFTGGGMRGANVKSREQAEIVATRTEPQREAARQRAGRERSQQLNIRFRMSVVGALEALAALEGTTLTAVLESLVLEDAKRRGITQAQIDAALEHRATRKKGDAA